MRKALLNTGLIVLSVALSLAAFEGLLRTGLLDDVSIHWIPDRYKAEDRRINEPSTARLNRHPFGFNGPITGFEAAGDKFRILVLGDSFVWGKGLPYDQGWGRKLAARIGQSRPDVEVVEWARNGWSTAHQLNFIEAVARDRLAADLAIIGFVVNDPDLGRDDWARHRKEINWSHAALAPLRAALPNTVNFLSGHVDAFMEVVTDDHGYANWVEYLWSAGNLEKYRAVLKRLKAAFDVKGIPVVFAFTPRFPDDAYFPPKFRKMAAILDDMGIAHVDLYPAVKAAFSAGDYGQGFRALWANPADPHPGDAVTTVVADTVLAHLEKTGALDRPVRRPPPAVRLEALPLCPLSVEFAINVVRVDRYPLSPSRPYYRVQGIAVEHRAPHLDAVRSVFVTMGGKTVPAMARLPLGIQLPNGKASQIEGWYAVDIPAAQVPDPTVQRITVVSRAGCKMVRNFDAPPAINEGPPPGLQSPPVVPIARVIGLAW